MPAVALILILLAAAAALDVVAERLRVPHPVLLVLGGLLLAVTPGLPRARLDPDIVFLVFVPPLLYYAALTTSWREFRRNARSILMLAIGLVLTTMAAVAVVAHRIVPGLEWAPAFILGAIVAPPDAIAATAVMRWLRVPRQVTVILEGEGLVNDAAALVAYRLAVAAAVSGTFSIARGVLGFGVAALGGVAIGLAVGVTVGTLRRALRDAPRVENTISLLTPYAAFVAADRLGLSGVLAVVAVGVYMGRLGPRLVSAGTRLQGAGMWSMITFLLEGLIFILIGLDLPLVLQHIDAGSYRALIAYGVLVSVATIVVRLGWMFPGAYLPIAFDRWRGKKTAYPPWRDVLFVGWAGMRGADSLVVALALPLTVSSGHPFPQREPIIFLTFVVILVTLVLQGLTLAPLIRLLGLKGGKAEAEEEIEARLRIAEAGLERLDHIEAQHPDAKEVVQHLRERHQHRVHRYAGRRRRALHRRDELYARHYRRVRGQMLDAERSALVRLRDEGRIGDEAMREVQRDLDLEQLLLESTDATLDDLEDL